MVQSLLKKLINLLKRPAELTPHAVIITSLIFITLFVTDRFNGAMNFVSHHLTESMFVICAIIFLYQTVVFFADFAKNKKVFVLVALSIVISLVGVYLAAVCIRDLNVEESPLMRYDYNKFLLCFYSVLSAIISFLVINIQRAYKMACNRKRSRTS